MEKILPISKLVIALGLISSGFAYADSASSLSSGQQSATQSPVPVTVVSPDPNSAAIPAQTTLPAPGLSPGAQESSAIAAVQGDEQQPAAQGAPATQSVPMAQAVPAQNQNTTNAASYQEQGSSVYPLPQQQGQGPSTYPSSQQYQEEQGPNGDEGPPPTGPDGPPCPGFIRGHYAQNNSWIPPHCPGQAVFVKGYYNQNGIWIPGHWVQTAGGAPSHYRYHNYYNPNYGQGYDG